jgi:hypothetical protein
MDLTEYLDTDMQLQAESAFNLAAQVATCVGL